MKKDLKGELEIKRFYLDGAKIKCPCGRKVRLEDYLSYPVLGEEEQYYFYCDKCEKDMEVTVKITAQVEVFEDTIREQ